MAAVPATVYLGLRVELALEWMCIEAFSFVLLPWHR